MRRPFEGTALRRQRGVIGYDKNGEVREAWPRGRRARFRAIPRRGRQKDFRERLERSVEAVARAEKDAGKRKPPQSCRQKGARLSCAADGKAFLRRRCGYGAGICAASCRVI